MPFISVRLDDVQESQPVPEGEYDLRVVKVEDGESKNGNQMTTIALRIEDADYPNAALVYHYLVYPNSSTSDDTARLFKLNIARFLQCFDVPFNEDEGFDSDDLSGAEGRCYLNKEEYEGNESNKLRLPKLAA